MTTLFVVSVSCGLFTKNAFADDKIITGGPGTCTVDVLGVNANDSMAYTIATYSLISYNCEPGTYLNVSNGSADCTDCLVGSYCPGGVFTVEDEYLGINVCPDGYTTITTKSISESDCIKNTQQPSTNVPSYPTDTNSFYATTPLMSAGGIFKFDISAGGQFTIDWGDGSVQTVNKEIGKETFSHTYANANQYTIEISSQNVTGYSTTDAAISFQCKDVMGNWLVENPLSAFGGTLGGVFPTLENNIQPLFIKTFYGCDSINNTKMPESLFSGLSGVGAPHMFDSTFYGWSMLQEISSDIFADLYGQPSESMFAFTFANTRLKSIPVGLFGNFGGTPTNRLFQGTFQNTEISNIPDTLFIGIKGDSSQPLGEYVFANTFEGTDITSIPAGLFSSVRGTPSVGMFSNTFAYTKITSIPENLFSTISGAPAKFMFQRTFASTPITSIPKDLFVSIKGDPAESMFASTFESCKSLSGQIPGSLFANISGAPVYGMFMSTFKNSSGLSSWIPPELFRGIKTEGFITGQMSDVFLGTGILEQCPVNMMQYITGFEADFDSKVSCTPCPENSTQDAGLNTYCNCGAGYTVGGVLNGTPQVKYGETCDAVVIHVTYSCGQNSGDSSVEPDSVSLSYNQSLTVASATGCVMGGYNFTGWQVRGTDVVEQPDEILTWNDLVGLGSQDIHLVATYEPDVFTITYNCDDGTLNDGATTTQTVTFGENFTTANSICTKANQAQTGWVAYSGETSFEYGLGQNTTWNFWEDKTFTATYTPAYTITYSCGNGTGDAPAKQGPILQDEEYAPQNNTCTAPAGYHFVGWSVSNTENIVRQPGQMYNYTFWENKTFTAIWEPNCNTITLDATTHGGINAVESVSQKTGQDQYYAGECYSPWYSIPMTPTKANATFSGFWNTPDLEGGVQCINSDKSFTYNDECNTTGPTTWYARFACNDGYTAAGVNIAGECKEKAYTITYDCGEGTGTPPSNQSIREGSNFTPYTNTCVKAGYDFDYWMTTNDGVTEAYYEKVSKPYKYDHDITLTAVYKIKPYSPDLENPALTIFFYPDRYQETEVIININAAGEFKIDWGDGSQPEKNSDSRVVYRSYRHRFAPSLSSYPLYIKIYGQASGYETTINLTDQLMVPTITFQFPKNSVSTIEGSLGALFPTLKDGRQPSFQSTFRDCETLKHVDTWRLFKGISGKPRAYMFAYTFEGTALEKYIDKEFFADIGGEDSTAPHLFEGTFANTNIPGIASDLFSNIKGVPKDYMFAGTFSGCSNIVLDKDKHGKLFRTISGPAAPYLFSGTFSGSGLTSIPDGLFDTIEGPTTNGSAEGLFHNTFSGTKIQEIPEDLFWRIETKPYTSIFHNTFSGCYQLKKIPGALFQSVKGDITDSAFYGTFDMAKNTVTGQTNPNPMEIPPELFAGITGKPANNMFNSTFRGLNITKIPENLFGGISGEPKSGMFLGTFMETNITEIPENLFAKIKDDPATKDDPAEGMFQQTFENTPITKIPAGLFKNISGKPVARMFQQTFKNCNKISSQIPENLFAGIDGALQYHTFYETFYGIVNTSFATDEYNFIPPKLFSNITKGSATSDNNAMYNLFSSSNLRTACPATHKRVDTGFEEWFYSIPDDKDSAQKVACEKCPEHADQRTKNDKICECEAGYGPGKPGDTYSVWVDEIEDNLKDGEICLPVRDTLRFYCQETIFGWKKHFDKYAYFSKDFTFPSQDEFEDVCGDLGKSKILKYWKFWSDANTTFIPGETITWSYTDQDNVTYLEPVFEYTCDDSADKFDWDAAKAEGWKFAIVTTPDTDAFAIKIAANDAEEFIIDWGDGSTTTARPGSAGYYYWHDYTPNCSYVIKIKGLAKSYPELDDNVGIPAVFGFTSGPGKDSTNYVGNIKRIYGSLGDMFPTLSDGTKLIQPKFKDVFKGAVNLEGPIPETLFTGTRKSDFTYPVYGAPRGAMFESAFEGCSKLSGTIPENLFSAGFASALSGHISERAFTNTFKGCSSLSGTIPALFGRFGGYAPSAFEGTFEGCSGLTGFPTDSNGEPVSIFASYSVSGTSGLSTSMFKNTFKDCTSLSGDIPYNLFDTYEKTGDSMFAYTFYGCSGLSGIGTSVSGKSLFSSIQGAAGLAKTAMFDSTFQGCSGLKSIPANLFSGIRGTAPRLFNGTFKGCTSITQIPSGLFSSISGRQQPHLFAETFRGCTGINKPLPEKLFAGTSDSTISGIGDNGTDYMFQYTFYDCNNMPGTIPENTFAGITTPGFAMFDRTFYNCKSLEGPIPGNLFGDLSGNVQKWMFNGTFAYCTNLDGPLPAKLFKGGLSSTGITGNPVVNSFKDMFKNTKIGSNTNQTWIPWDFFSTLTNTNYKAGPMTDIFLSSSLVTECPENMYVYKTGFESDFDGKVACKECPSGQYQDPDNKYQCKVLSYTLSYDCNGGTGTPPSSEKVWYKKTFTPYNGAYFCSKPGYTFGGWYFAEDSSNTTYQPLTTYTYSWKSNKKLLAKWDQAVYTVILHSNHYETSGDGVSIGLAPDVAATPTPLYSSYESPTWHTDKQLLSDSVIKTLTQLPKLNKYMFTGFTDEKFPATNATRIISHTGEILPSSFPYTKNTTLYAQYSKCKCNPGFGVETCDAVETNDNNECVYEIKCKTGYVIDNPIQTSAFIPFSPICIPAKMFTITLDSAKYTQIDSEIDTNSGSRLDASVNAAPETLYLKQGYGWYKDSTGESAISALSVLPSITSTVGTEQEFNGFYTGKAGTGIQIIDKNGNLLVTEQVLNAFDADATIYADYITIAKTYNVSYSCGTGSGTPPESQSILFGQEFVVAENTNCAAENKNFIDWHVSNTNTYLSPNQSIAYTYATNITLTARYANQTYNVAYDKNNADATGDAPDSPYTCVVGESCLAPDNTFVFIGHEFTGWTCSGATKCNEDGFIISSGYDLNELNVADGDTITLFAQWAPSKFNIEYAGNGGTGDNPTLTYCAWDDATCLAPENPYVRKGYYFDTWEYYIDNTGNLGLAEPGFDLHDLFYFNPNVVTLKALWNPMQVNIRYDGNGGTTAISPIEPTHCSFGSACVVPDNPYTKDGYMFTGWLCSGEKCADTTRLIAIGESIHDLLSDNVADGDTITLVAQWAEKPAPRFYVVYNANGGQGAAPSEPTVCLFDDVNCAAPKNTFIRTGYKFEGWLCTGEDTECSGTIFNPSDSLYGASLVDGATVYLVAQWTPITFTVSYNTNGGTPRFATQTCTYDEDCFIPENKPYKTGYEFKRWCEVEDCPIVYMPGDNLRNLTGLDKDEIVMNAIYDKIEIDFNLEYYETDDSTEPFAIQTCSMHEPCIVKDAITRTGYKFNTWRCSGDVACNGENIAPSTDLFNVSIDGSTVKLTGVWDPNKFNVVYDGNGGTTDVNPIEPSVCFYGQNCFAPENMYVYDGYDFTNWTCTCDSGTCVSEVINEGDNISTLTSVDGATITLTAQWMRTPEFPFQVTTTSDTTEFAFYINATGRFYVDWGDGTKYETITISDTSGKEVLHTYQQAGTYVIKIGGAATGYGTSDEMPTISFIDNTNVKYIDGSLGAIFSTLPDGTQPSFFDAFYGCANLTGELPEELFVGISGIGRPRMFVYTFANTDIQTIPDTLFAPIEPVLTDRMFMSTFTGCDKLTSIPALFDGFTTSAPRAFQSTFSDCTALESIPENLFGITDNPSDYMFVETFAGCTNITEIPGNLFAQLGNTPGTGVFQNTFAATGITEVPAELFASITTPSENLFNGTFESCENLTTVPKDLFQNITSPAPGLFYGTFANTGLTAVPELFTHMSGTPDKYMFSSTFRDSKISSAIPANLFGNISGNPAQSMMSNMFARTSATNYIPPTLFANINNTDYTAGPMSSIFEDTQMWTECPTEMRQFITGFEIDLSGKVSCVNCPAYSAQRADDATWCQCFEGYSLDGTSTGEIYTQTIDCQPIKYNAIYSCGDGSGTAPSGAQVMYGTEYTVAENTECVRNGYTFTGWETDINDIKYTAGEVITWNWKADVTFTATWQKNAYTITFDKMGGTGGTDSVTVMYNELPPVIEVPTKAGYDFVGYYDAESIEQSTKYYEGNGTPSLPWNVASDGTLYAQYIPKMYHYNYFCSETEVGPEGGDIMYGDYLLAAESTCTPPTGYIFDTWLVSGTADTVKPNNSLLYKYTSDKVLHASFVPGTYTITFHSNYDEDRTVVETFVYDNAYFLRQQYLRPGSEFIGYATTPDGEVVYKDGDIVSNLTDVVGGNVDLYSIWETITTPFEYDGNGGTQVVYPIVPTTCSGNETCIAPENPFERPGYEFIGWTCFGHVFCDNGLFAPGTDLRSSIIATISKNEVITMTAQWKPITFTVVYDVDGGNPEIESQTCTYDTECFVSDITPTKPGYSFETWEYVDGTNKDLISPSADITNITDVANATISLVAKYTPNTYTITYNANGGTGDMLPTTFTYGDTVTLASNTFVRDGYEFNGWSTTTDGGVEYTDSQEISGLTGDITLYAVWAPVYTIIYNANGGAGEMSPTTFTYGDTVTLSPNTFIRDGYEFNGWSTTTDGGVEYTDSQEISGLTGDITLYAVWSVAMCVVNSYTPSSALTGLETVANMAANSEGKIYYDSGSSAYKFKDNGMELYDANQEFTVKFANGTLTGLAFCGVNGSYKLYNTTSKFNYYQTGRGCWCRYGVDHVNDSGWKWQRATNFSNVDMCRSECPMVCAQLIAEDTQFRANLLADSGTEEYDALLNGDCPSDNLVSKCDNRVGYTYTYNEDTDECNYTPITYTVTYNTNGGEGDMAVDTFTYDVAGILSPNTFTRTGYTFNGWAITADGEKVYNDEAEVLNWANTQGTNIDLYALWTPITYTVTYNANGGTGNMESMTFNYGDDVTLAQNTFTRDGYEFNGWSTTSNGEVEYTDGQVISGLTGDVTLYAVWLPIYTITYNANGGVGEIPQTEFASGTTVTLAQNTFTRDGYEFNGWSTSANGATEYSDGQAISGLTGDITLYAVWTELATQTYTITYNANGGAGNMESTTFNYGDDVTLSSNTFTRSEYSFAGWATTPDGEKVYSDAQTISGLANNLDLYAVWLVTQCTVTGYAPTVTLTDLETIENITANSGGGIVKKSGVYYFETSEGVALYNQGQEFTVDFSHGSITGTALCGVNGGSAYNKAGHIMDKLNGWQAGKGCWCRYGTSTDEVYTVTLDDGSTKTYPWGRAYTAELASSVDACRAECPRVCAEKVATDTTFRKNLLLIDTECPPDNMLSPCDPQEGYTASYDKDTNECTYTPITYTVTYNANGGEGDMAVDTFTYDVAGVLSENTFERTGYTFAGWATTSDGEMEYENNAVVLNWAKSQGANIDLYALWTPITYTITYDANGGTGNMESMTFNYGDDVTLAQNTFTRDGYEFNGWSTSANGATEYSDGQAISGLTGDITLYAVWTELATPVSGYTVIYSCGTGEGGAAPATTTVEYGTEFTPAANTCEKACNTFIGWQISDTDIITTSSFTWDYTTNKVLTAQWAEDECDEGGATTCDPSTCPTTNVTPTSAISAKTASELASANIIGPSISTSTPINNMAAYVEDQRWSVTFANSGKTINGFAICGPSGKAKEAAGHSTNSKNHRLDKTLSANQAYYGCYCKSGDNITDDTLYASLKQLKPSGTTTAAQKIDYCRANCPYECANAVATDAIYRKAMLADTTDSVCECNENSGGEECCEPNPDNETFKIHMYTDVYTKIGETNVTYNQAISGLLTPEQANKVFVGWFDEGGVQYSNGDIYTKQTDTIVYARWEQAAIQYTVAYNANGGNGDMESSVFTYGVAGKLSPNTFTRTDYNFLGWAKTSDATVPEYADQAEVIDWSNINGDIITLYAVWQEIPATYTITYHANGGTGEMAQSTFNMDVEYSLSLNEFTRAGYTFKHWATNSDGSGNTYTDGQNVTNLTTNRGANVDLYAVWQPKIYTITYMANGGLSADYSLNIEFGANMPNVDIPTPADGYVFTGYYLEPTGGTQYYDATGTPVSTYVVYNRTENLVLYAGWKARACEPTGNYSPTSVLTDITTISELVDAEFVYLDSGANAYKFNAGGMTEYNKDQRFTFEYSDGINTSTQYGTAFCGPNGTGDRTKLYYTTDKLSVYQTGKGCWCRYGLSDDEVYTATLDDGSTKTYPWQRAATSTDADTCRTECPMICAQYAATDEKFRTKLLNGDVVSCADNEIECPDQEGYTGTFNPETGQCDYTLNTYTITLDPDGGTTTQTSISVKYQGDIPNAEIPTYDGYLFMGYFTDRNGAGDKFFDEFGTPISPTYTLTTDITVYAYWKEPACTDYDGTVLERCDTPIMSSQEMVDNGLLEYKSTSEYKITDFDKYMRNQKWAVNFPTYGEGTGTISGSAFCGPVSKAEYGTIVKSIEDLPLAGTTLKQAHAGCWCQVGPTDATKFWVAAGKYDEGSTWAEKTDACRASCPDFCAQLVATDSEFRAKLYGGEDSCPVGTNYKKACCDGEYETEDGTYEPCPDGTWCMNCQKNECDAEAMYTATNGATSPNACGTYLHVGDHKIFMRQNAKMTPLALHVNKRGTIFHANMSTEKPDDGKEKHLKTMVDGVIYYIYDNFLI